MHEDFELDNWMLLFILKGHAHICLNNNKQIELNTSQVILLPVNSLVTISALSDIQMIKCSFYNSLDFKIGNYIEGLRAYVSPAEAEMPILSINEPLAMFLSFILCLGDKGLNCSELNRLLTDELFILLKAYYSVNDLALLFSNAISQSFDFKSFILKNYKGKDVQSLAEACNMSIATFNRRFRENFGESALQWINKRKAETIYNDLRQTRKSLIEIADEHQFSSTSYLTTFCKKYFNNTPEQIRSQRICKVSLGCNFITSKIDRNL
ncbi:MAG: helix-turn-helix transcriptional regulator [Bacteroidales bacterium]